MVFVQDPSIAHKIIENDKYWERQLSPPEILEKDCIGDSFVYQRFENPISGVVTQKESEGGLYLQTGIPLVSMMPTSHDLGMVVQTGMISSTVTIVDAGTGFYGNYYYGGLPLLYSQYVYVPDFPDEFFDEVGSITKVNFSGYQKFSSTPSASDFGIYTLSSGFIEGLGGSDDLTTAVKNLRGKFINVWTDLERFYTSSVLRWNVAGHLVFKTGTAKSYNFVKEGHGLIPYYSIIPVKSDVYDLIYVPPDEPEEE